MSGGRVDVVALELELREDSERFCCGAVVEVVGGVFGISVDEGPSSGRVAVGVFII